MRRVAVLMYHQVGSFGRPRSHPGCFCRIDRFETQMRTLARLGFRVIGLADAIDWASGSGGMPQSAPSVVLSFDDGTDDFLRTALPILARFNYPAAVFPVSGLLGMPASFAGYRPTPSILSASQLRELRDMSVEIGSHTVTHRHLSTLGDADLRYELCRSKEHLEQVLDVQVNHLCYPSGDVDDRVRNAARSVGYRCGLTTRAGVVRRGMDPFDLPRIKISYGDDAIRFAWKLLRPYGRSPGAMEAAYLSC